MKKFSFCILIASIGFVVSGCSSTTNKGKVDSKRHQVASATQVIKSKNEESILVSLKNKSNGKIRYSPMGDSLSQGLFAKNRRSDFVNRFTYRLEKNTGKKVLVSGAYSVGKTATNFGVPSISQVIKQKPDLVTIEFGTNDAVGGTSQMALSQYRSSIVKIITELKSHTHAQLILMSAWCGPTRQQLANNEVKFDQVIQKIGTEYKIPVANLRNIWAKKNNVTGPAGRTYPDFASWGQSDNFHPNQLGHRMIADELFKVVNESPVQK